MRTQAIICSCTVLFAAIGLGVGQTQAGVLLTDVQFNRDIRPILVEKCFACHGPDAKDKKTTLRPDSAASCPRQRTRHGNQCSGVGIGGVVPGLVY